MVTRALLLANDCRLRAVPRVWLCEALRNVMGAKTKAVENPDSFPPQQEQEQQLLKHQPSPTRHLTNLYPRHIYSPSTMSKRTNANASNGSAKELAVGEPGMPLAE